MKWTKNSIARIKLLHRYEPIQPFFLRWLSGYIPIDTFFDIGANIGYYSLIFADYMPALKVHSFEPNPWAFDELNKNIVLNDLVERITPHRVALSSRKGQETLSIISKLSGANSITQEEGRGAATTIQVQCGGLDDLLFQSGNFLFLKIDVEGHEMAVLKGAQSILNDSNCLIQIEILEETENSGVLHYLRSLGYRQFFRLGPDFYLTNIEDIFLNSRQLIEEFFDYYINLSKRRPRRR